MEARSDPNGTAAWLDWTYGDEGGKPEAYDGANAQRWKRRAKLRSRPKRPIGRGMALVRILPGLQCDTSETFLGLNSW